MTTHLTHLRHPGGTPPARDRRAGGSWSAVAGGALAAVAGLALLRLLARRIHGVLGWSCAAGFVLLVSLAGPLGASTLSAGLTLLGLHLLVAAVVAATAYRIGHWLA